MYHFSSLFTKKPRFRSYCTLFSILAAVVFITGITQPVSADERGSQPKNMIHSVSGNATETTLSIQIHGSNEPAYTVYELFQPARIVVDIADTAINSEQSLTLPASLPVTLQASTVSDAAQALTRFEFTLANDYSGYDVKTNNNDIIITVAQGSKGATGQVSIESQLPQMTIAPSGGSLASDSATKSAGSSLKDSFTFGGYNKTRITVDFYKIDLHNVFRLLREISNVNIVVDEAVAGSLTLALNDVPWDFALDIILNLKDLQKEERFNTIVILPKAKEFSWPERAEDNLSFEADDAVAVQEAIVIQQQRNVPPEIVEAKKTIQKGREFEKNGDYENAIKMYSDAFAAWQDNERLANKIASIYLVYLRQNAKAAYFAKQALQINSNNDNAALNAAIALANMQENSEAQQYFDQSVSVEKPSETALLSYAVFSEGQQQFDSAIKLLDKYGQLYGKNLTSMVAYARILDKQGNHEAATEKYKSVLLSGFQIPPDLKKYIKSRISLNQSM